MDQGKEELSSSPAHGVLSAEPTLCWDVLTNPLPCSNLSWELGV